MNTYSKKIEINNENLIQEINMILKNKKDIVEFKLSEIEIPINNDNSDKVKLNDLMNVIKEIGFEEAALKLSISSTAENRGDLGWISSTSFSKKILNVIQKLRVGEIRDPSTKQGSVTILKLVDKRQSNVKDLDMEKLKKSNIK